jgi:hypothetical protein
MFVKSKKCFLGAFFSAKVYIHLEKFGHASEGGATVFIQRLSVYLPPCRVLVAHFIRYIFLIEQITFSNFGPREHSRDWMDKRGIFLEDFWRIFLGGIYLEKFLGGFFWQIFGRIFLRRILWG